MFKQRAKAFYIVIIAVLIGYWVYTSQFSDGQLGHKPFRLGLDLSGGSHLVYKADISKLDPSGVDDAMSSLREVVERRVNVFGVSEPLVQVEKGGTFGTKEGAHKLIVELPGVTDVNEAAKSIGATPSLDFKLVTAADMNAFQSSDIVKNATSSVEQMTAYLELFEETGLTGRMVSKANLQSNSITNKPSIGLVFTSEGRDLFAQITKNHIGDYLGIFLDGQPISVPVIRDAITNGQGEISGSFTDDEARKLVRDLNYGALPAPIELLSIQTVGPSLGQAAVNGGIRSGIIAFILIGIFLIVWYRLPGLLAVFALGVFTVINLLLFKIGISPGFLMVYLILLGLGILFHKGFYLLIPIFYIVFAMVPNALTPVTLTAAGIAGFILSIGMAVDANILIFERMKEELARGRSIPDAMHEGFDRAWLSIRDSNMSSIITGFILYFFGSTSVITGFALVFIVGVLVSMFTAITASRLFLYAVAPKETTKLSSFLISNGFKKLKM